MKRAAFLGFAAILLLTAIPLLSLGAQAGPLDERMFVGTWKGYNRSGSPIIITWNADGTGHQEYENNPEWNYEFEWKLEGGQYSDRYDAEDEWAPYGYEFSSFYSKLVMTYYGEESISVERDSSIISDVCCSSCCCGGVILPLLATSTFIAVGATLRRR